MEITAIDRIDRRILSVLVENGRASFSAIGNQVSLSPHAVAERVRKLQRAGVIRSITAQVDLGAVGRGLDAYVDVRLLPMTNPDEFEATAREISQIREIAFVTGRFDYQLRLACADADDLDRALRALRTRAGAATTETRIVLRSHSLSPAIPA